MWLKKEHSAIFTLYLINNFKHFQNLNPKLTQNVETYTNEEFKPTEAPVAPEGYALPQPDAGYSPFAESQSPQVGCRNYKGEEVPCNLG